MVATWKTEEQGTVACDKCGARYKPTVTRFPTRDNDHFNCEVCGHRMDEWNSTHAPSYELVDRGTAPND